MTTRSTRAKRSQSVDSALNKVASGRTQSQNNLNQSIIYELDSEEEDQLLAQFAGHQDVAPINGTDGYEKESSVDLEDGAARSRVTQKRKTATSSRGRKPASTSVPGKSATTTRGRKKLRKDSGTMEVEVD